MVIGPASAASTVQGPLSRLSRFDGTTFHPVVEGGVGAEFVHVFVHGWQPGFQLQERLHAVTDVVEALPSWDPRLIDPSGRTLISYYLPLLRALVELGPEHCVLWYSWLDESATDADLMLAFRSRQATQVNGRRLALALQQSFGGGRPRLHLIGHSHGSAVATHAAVSLGRAPDQLTLLDAPESSISRLSGAANLIDVVLPRLHPGRGPGRPFVESYWTVFGRSYHRKPGLSAVVDVVLTAGRPPERHPVQAINWVHLYAVDWYARSVSQAGQGVGYGWSPLRGVDTASLLSFYQSLRPTRPLQISRRPQMPRPGAAEANALRTPRRTPVTGPGLRLSEDRPVAAKIVHSAPGDGLIEFDLDVRGGDGSELVQLELDAVPVFVAQGRFPVPAAGRYVMLADGRAGEHLLTARLITRSAVAGRRAGDVATGPAPRVVIDNLVLVSGPGVIPGFSFQRLAVSSFVGGAVAGSVVTALTLVTTSWTVRAVLGLLTRHRRRA